MQFIVFHTVFKILNLIFISWIQEGKKSNGETPTGGGGTISTLSRPSFRWT